MDLASEYKAIARGLGDLQIIDMELSAKLVQMAGYRNRLVHLYHIVNDEELYEIITTDLGDIVKFISAMKEYINVFLIRNFNSLNLLPDNTFYISSRSRRDKDHSGRFCR